MALVCQALFTNSELWRVSRWALPTPVAGSLGHLSNGNSDRR